jgi:hypothetical protein
MVESNYSFYQGRFISQGYNDFKCIVIQSNHQLTRCDINMICDIVENECQSSLLYAFIHAQFIIQLIDEQTLQNIYISQPIRCTCEIHLEDEDEEFEDWINYVQLIFYGYKMVESL